jgi:hypothetical protein
MRALSSSELLDVWERGSVLHPLDRAMLALHAALPEVSPTIVADWSLGRLNQALIDLHCASFGQAIQGWSACANCGEKMEFAIDGRELVSRSISPAAENETVSFNGQLFRLPTSRDLAAAAQEKDPDAAALALAGRCCTTPPMSWNADELEQLGEIMSQADPLAEVRIALSCPSCGHESSETIEMSSFIWSETVARARRLLWEVHAIASAYGWTEKEILSMSPRRRAGYVEMVHA